MTLEFVSRVGVYLNIDGIPGPHPTHLRLLEVRGDPNVGGHVQSIQYGSGARFSAFPAENATGNFVKIVQRIPVKIVIDRGLDANAPLPLGLSVSPIVHFR
jgi:multidrug resistance efflux pump